MWVITMISMRFPELISGILMKHKTYLYNWQLVTTQDVNSMSYDPLFVDVASGDFHLRSVTPSGTYVNAISARTNFSEHSPCIDAGPAFGSTTNEPDPNGGRINLGAYGNTDMASLSRTNPWVLVLTMNDGGKLSLPTNVTLRWNYGNLSDGDPVQLWFSRNDGHAWESIITNTPVQNRSYTWSISNVIGKSFMLVADFNRCCFRCHC